MNASRLSMRARAGLLALAALVLAGVAVGYTVRAAERRPEPAAAEATFTLEGPRLYFRSAGSEGKGNGGRVAYRPVDGPAPGARTVGGGPACERFYAAGGTGLCLQRRPGVPPRTYAVVLDRRMREVRRVAVPGIPNRARVSASGRMLSWTNFAVGDSYASSSFSTRTSILDLRTGFLVKNMEQIPLTIDGRRYHAPDVNYWGVTFARDDNRFYATVSTKGRTYLVEGDMRAWSARALRENVECPSLSPDNTRLVFKKQVRDDPRRPWRLYALDLRTMREWPLAETRSVDDQAAWLDNDTVAYGLAPGDIWSVPASGTARPRLLIRGGTSPSPVR
ncbi:hypothetical protein ACF08N_30100 [Streptomyces sp. NPDC015127]|uniref:hypothetical protein n=1 Tax=Streptomyces sp. NPDC015127 TaxID=3364939 RepID=UPI0036F71A87